MESAPYTERQIAGAVQKGLVNFGEFLDELRRETEDSRLMLYVDRLLMHIYLHHLEGRHLSKTQACRLIPAEHMDTCAKYVQAAKKLGFFTEEDDGKDSRKKLILPTRDFIEFVEIKAAASLDDIKALLEG